MSRQTGDRGSATIELVILAPAFGLVIALLVMGGRLVLAEQAMDGAAAEAARSVSLQRGQDSAAATQAAQAYLGEEGLSCEDISVQITTEAKDTNPGTPGEITTTVSCHVPLSDLAIPGVGGGRTLTATASSPIDTYRER